MLKEMMLLMLKARTGDVYESAAAEIKELMAANIAMKKETKKR